MELDPEARRTLGLAASARLPTAQNKAEVERRLAVALGAAAVSSLAAAEAGKFAWLSRAALLKAAAAAGALVVASLAGLHFRQPVLPAAIETAAAIEALPPSAAALAAPPSAHVPPPSAAAEPRTEAPQARSQRRRAASTPARQPASDTLALELELLHRAQTAWRAHQPQLALELLEQHRTSYPRSSLQLERDGLRVLSLCELGRRDQAQPLLRALLRQAPDSPLRPSLERACADH